MDEVTRPRKVWLLELSARQHFANTSWEELGIRADLTEDEIIHTAKQLDWQVLKYNERQMLLVDTERFVRESVHYLRYHKEDLRQQIRQYQERVGNTLRYLQKNDPELKEVTLDSVRVTVVVNASLYWVPIGVYRYGKHRWYVGDCQKKPGAPWLWGWIRYVEGDRHQAYQGGLLTDPSWRVAADTIGEVADSMGEEHVKRRGFMSRPVRFWQHRPPKVFIDIDPDAPGNTYAEVEPTLTLNLMSGMVSCETERQLRGLFLSICGWALPCGVWPRDVHGLATDLEEAFRQLLDQSGAAPCCTTFWSWATPYGERIERRIAARVKAWGERFISSESYFAGREQELRLHPWMTSKEIAELADRLENECEAKGVHVRGTEAWVKNRVGRWRKPNAKTSA